ncbi:hypothetical protein RvVAT039_26670 [Agrobacterium vitis]|nr:hypothetical protein RvVAT039_26670 [Agrobacterium vitis]
MARQFRNQLQQHQPQFAGLKHPTAFAIASVLAAWSLVSKGTATHRVHQVGKWMAPSTAMSATMFPLVFV